MDLNKIGELVDLLAAYFTGPDAPLNARGLSISKGGKFQLRERAERFYQIRKEFGVSGFPTPEEARRSIRKQLGLREIT